MKANTISHEKRNVLQKMVGGYELFHWGDKAKTVHLRKTKSGELGTIGERLKKNIFSSLIEQGFISKFKVEAGRTFYALTESGKKLCS